jgi:hypothetical protein
VACSDATGATAGNKPEAGSFTTRAFKEEDLMRKTALIAASLAATVALAACSEQTQKSAENAADSASKDVQAAASAAGDVAKEGAAAVESAADKAAAASDRMGAKVEEHRARIEADAQNESVDQAKRD